MFDRARMSMWLGNGCASGRELVAYMLTRFPQDFGFEAQGPLISLLDWAKTAPLRRVDTLLKPFARSSQWSRAAVEVARKAGWLEARAAVVLDSFEYDISRIVNRSAPLTYVGSFGR